MEIGRLTAIFDADDAKFSAVSKRVESGTSRVERSFRSSSKSASGFSDAMRGVGQSVSTLDGPMGGISSRISSVTSLFKGLSSSGAAVGVALGIVAVATVGAAYGIYKLVVASAEATGKLFDLSQQTGFSVETLSALKNAAETSGGSIESITSALFLFETKMGEAKDATSETGKMFQALSIDTTNNEQALRQSIETLLAMTNAEDQATVGKKLFGRSVKDLLGAIKEAGSLDAFMNEQIKDGTLITTDAAKKGDLLGDSITKIGQKLSAVGRQIASEFAPMVADGLGQFSRWLKDNQAEIIKTAKGVAGLVKDISNLASFIYQISPIKLQIDIIRRISTLNADLQGPSDASTGGAISGGTSMFDRLRDFVDRGPLTGSRGGMVPVNTSRIANQTKEQIAATAKGNIDAAKQVEAAQKKLRDALASLSKPGGKAGGGGGSDAAQTAKRIAELQLQAITDGLKREAEMNRRGLDLRRRDFDQYATQYMTIENRRHTAVIDGLDKEQKAAERLKKGREVALLEIENKRTQENTTHEQNRNKVLDERARILDQINNFMRDQQRDIAGISVETNRWDQALQSLVDSLIEQGVAQDDNILKQAKMNAALGQQLDVLERTRKFIASEELFTVGLLGQEPGGKLPTEEEVARDLLDKVNSQIGLPPASYEKLRNQLVQLGHDITSVFGYSVNAGFQEGIKSGLQELSLGLLDVLQNVFLKRLADGLSELLGGLASGGGLPKWLGFILGIAGSAAGGAIGGGIGGGKGALIPGAAGKGFASGGFLKPGQWGIAGEQGPEPIYGGHTGMTVIPNNKMGQPVVHNHYVINLPPAPNTSYNPRRSARQQADMILAALQGNA